MLTVPFFGDNIDDWLKHFSFSENLAACLKDELEVGCVDDLKYIYDDPELLKAVENKAARLQYRKFIDAQALTNPPEATAANANIPLADAVVVTADPDAPAPKKAVKKTTKERKDEEAMHALFLKSKKEHDDAAAIEVRKKAIGELNIQLQHAASLDIAFLVDGTGSMQPYITAVLQDINAFVRKIHDLHPDTSLRVAFVCYRDHCDANRLEIQPFTADIAIFKAFVQQLRAGGGGDEPEDVFGGLNAAAQLEWASSHRVLFHVADQPCHGVEFHGNSTPRYDSYPMGDPNGLQALPLLTAFAELNIKCYFGKITDHTDKMIARFNEIMGNPAFITTTAVSNLSLIGVVTKSVSTAMSASLSSSGRTGESAMEHKKVFLDDKVPKWSAIPKSEAALEYTMLKTNSINEMLADGSDRCVQNVPKRQNIKMASNPFAEGGQRAAYYGRVCSGKGGCMDVIFKESLALDERYRTKLSYEKFLVCHRAAKFLAEEFNKASPSDCAGIHYCDANIFQLMMRYPEQPFMIMETMVPGDFEKFNSNTGYCAPCPSDKGTNHQAVQAFSHWTHHVTAGRLMVVDCQGGYDPRSNRFLLTDPAVHAVNLLQFGKTNLGEEGVRRFFATHKCSAICRAMGLTMPGK